MPEMGRQAALGRDVLAGLQAEAGGPSQASAAGQERDS